MWIKLVYFISGFLSLIVTADRLAPTGTCANNSFDIVFAIDTSSSIWKPDFELEKKFIWDFADNFDIGLKPNQTRIGVITFADHFYLQFHLWQNNRRDLLERALTRIRHRAGRKTDTGEALKYMVKHMFSRRYGARANSIHVAVIITDGKSQDRRKTIQQAVAARKAGINVFAIGVGDAVEYRELEQIASFPPEEYVFEVEDFKSLDTMKYVLANKTCIDKSYDYWYTGQPQSRAGPLTPPPKRIVATSPPTLRDVTIPIPSNEGNRATTRSRQDIQADIDPRLNVTNCGGKPADIFFALDASNSIWPIDFKKQLKFIRDLISMFDISSAKTRVGLVTFSDRVRVIFDFNTKQEESILFKHMENIKFMSGRTKTADALKFVHEQGFSRDVARPGVAHIMLIFTDGISKRPHETAREAELAKRDGIYMFAIGIGHSVERTELRDIASDPDDDFVFHVSNFSVLNTIKNILAIKTCAIEPDDFVRDQEELTCPLIHSTDLMFVYDSAQLGIPRTRRITKFVYDVTTALDVEAGRLRVGRLLENCLTSADVFLTGQKVSMDFDGILFPDYRRLIRKLASQGYAQPYGARRFSKKVAVLFIDDEMENLKMAAEEMARLRETHVMVVTIGDMDLLTAASFSSRPANDYIVHIPSYKYLHTARSTLIQKLCKIFAKTDQVIN